MATVVICDGDAVARSAVTTLCEEAGLEVVAETDRGADAVELIRRFGVEVLVLDLSLPEGSGEDALAALKAGEAGPAVVVFTTYVSDQGHLLDLGVREVVEKPDFEQLAKVLTNLARSLDEGGATPANRRLASREVGGIPEGWRSPSGVAPHVDLSAVRDSLEAGDAMLAVTIVGLDEVERDAGPLLAADCRLAVARALRKVLRTQDLLHEAPEVDGFVALLRGGDARSADAVWKRLVAHLEAEDIPGDVRGAACRVSEEGGKHAEAQALRALQGASTSGTAFVKV